MRASLILIVAGVLLAPLAAFAQDAAVSLDAVAAAMRAGSLQSIEYRQVLAVPSLINADLLERSGRKATVQTVGTKHVLTDGARVVELHHIAGNGHADGLLMAYLPKEKLLVQADAYNPLPPNAEPPMPPNPSTVNLADNIARLGLAVDQHLPLHGRIVPTSELNRTIRRAP